MQKTVVWDEGPGGELVIKQKLLVPKESHMVSRAGLGGGTRTLLSRGSSQLPDSQLMALFFTPPSEDPDRSEGVPDCSDRTGGGPRPHEHLPL